ncbi:MAG: hypothetical protein EOP04_32585, partial [Proteobacteria bacterium]
MSDFTISFWMHTSLNQMSGTCSRWDDGTGLVHSGPGSFASNDYGISICDGRIVAGAGSTSVTPMNYVNDSRWHMVTFSRQRSNGDLKVYIDGTFASSQIAGTALLNTRTTLDLGTSNGTNFYSGNLDELTIWESTLTGEEVNALYQRQSPKFSGYATSRVMSTPTVQPWTGLQWKTNKPFGKELPDYDGSPMNETNGWYQDIV